MVIKYNSNKVKIELHNLYDFAVINCFLCIMHDLIQSDLQLNHLSKLYYPSKSSGIFNKQRRANPH